uniref:Uncharacterized protein n=1 Tax=Parascaris equorum TaxID=6256 RepID=A0A914S563_PAREQ
MIGEFERKEWQQSEYALQHHFHCMMHNRKTLECICSRQEVKRVTLHYHATGNYSFRWLSITIAEFVANDWIHRPEL